VNQIVHLATGGETKLTDQKGWHLRPLYCWFEEFIYYVNCLRQL